MSEQPGQLPPDDQAEAPEAPRREASARFEVAATAGAEAAMRQAMDPANQSLGEALRLSYRVLQGAIVVLVAVFLLSGFQQVQEGQTGVKAVFGRIQGEPGAEAVSPGLQPFWPYPVGEIVRIPQKDAVQLNREFWPRFKDGVGTLEQATAAALADDPIRPGEDGSLITADGDLVHVRISAEFTVEDVVRTLGEFPPVALREVVRRSLQRGMVQTAAEFTLQELLESREHWRTLQQFMIEHLHRPVFEQWMRAAVAVGQLDLPGYELMPERYDAVKWFPRGWGWVDPEKEVNAYKDAVRCGFATQAQIVAEQGGDLEELLVARKAEVDRAQELELQFDTNPADDDLGGYVEPMDPAAEESEDSAEGEQLGLDSLSQDGDSNGLDA